MKFAILGIPYDTSAGLGYPGARYAPAEVRKALQWTLNRIREERTVDVETRRMIDFHGVVIEDVGDVAVVGYDHERTLQNIKDRVAFLLGQDYVPIIIGGDHSVSYPCIAALHDATPGATGLIQMDAHLDLVDSNPIQGRLSGSSEIRRALELGRISPKNVVQVGVRGYNYPDQLEYVQSEGIAWYTPIDVDEMGIREVARRSLQIAKAGTERVYFTLDIDVMDPAFAPGSGADEPGGLSSRQTLDFVRAVAPHVDVMDIVEVNPLTDTRRVTAAVAARLIFDFIVARLSSPTG